MSELNYGFRTNKKMMRLLHKQIKKLDTPVWKVLHGNAGLSYSAVTAICARLGLNHKVKIKSLTAKEVRRLHYSLSRNFITNDSLTGNVANRFTEVYQENTRRGFRLRQGLPVNGQRTRSNAKTPRRLKGAWLSRRYKQQMRKLYFQRLLREKKRMQSRKAQLLLRKEKARAKAKKR